MKKLMAAVTCALAALFVFTSASAESMVWNDKTIYVDCSVASSGDGSSWKTAYKTIQEAVDAAAEGDIVMVAPGTYDTGSTTIWTGSNGGKSIAQQVRVLVPRRVWIKSSEGREKTIILGSHGTQDAETNTGTTSNCYRTNGVACVCIGNSASGTRIQGFTFKEGYQHQSAMNGDSSVGNSMAAGGVIRQTVRADNDFLVMDCFFDHCYGRGAGGMVGGSAIRCIFDNCFTTWGCASAYASRLYNCVSRDAYEWNEGGSDVDFEKCLAINCTTYANFSRGSFLNSTLVNCLTFGNHDTQSVNANNNVATNTWGDCSVTDDSLNFTQLGTSKEEQYLYSTNFYISVNSGNYHPIKNGPIVSAGNYLLASQADFIPAEELLKNFDGVGTADPSEWPIGVVNEPREVKSGLIDLTAMYHTANGCSSGIRTDHIYVRSDKYPDDVVVSSNAKRHGTEFFHLKLCMRSQQFYVSEGKYYGKGVRVLMPPAGETYSMQAERIPNACPIYYVGDFGEGGTPSDDNDGLSKTNSFATINKAITMVTSGMNKILVAPGTYGPEGASTDAEGQKSVIYIPTGVNVQITAVEGPEKTFIVGAPDEDTGDVGAKAVRAVYAKGGGALQTISGFTFTNCYAKATSGYSYYDYTVVANHQKTLFYDCVFTDQHGYCLGSKGTYFRCIFRNNPGLRAAVLCGTGRESAGEANCAACSCIFDNAIGTSNGILYNHVDAYNCTFYSSAASTGYIGNKNDRIFNSVGYLAHGSMIDFTASVSGSNRGYLMSNVVWTASNAVQSELPDGVIYANPYFNDPENGDFRLHRPTVAEGFARPLDAEGVMSDVNMRSYYCGDINNNSLFDENGVMTPGAVVGYTDAIESLFVDATNGDDDNDGFTDATAKKTLKGVVEAVASLHGNDAPDKTITALPGIYNEGTMSQSERNYSPNHDSNRMNEFGTYFTVKSRAIIPEGGRFRRADRRKRRSSKGRRIPTRRLSRARRRLLNSGADRTPRVVSSLRRMRR